jgi:alpha-beta hydrolase superfamily lysophospholipase
MTQWVTAEGHFRSFDGILLFYRPWKQNPSADRALIVIHRGHEHSGRVGDVVEEFDLQDARVFSRDCRGTRPVTGRTGLCR